MLTGYWELTLMLDERVFASTRLEVDGDHCGLMWTFHSGQLKSATIGR